jgi:hypothetical protein
MNECRGRRWCGLFLLCFPVQRPGAIAGGTFPGFPQRAVGQRCNVEGEKNTYPRVWKGGV